MRIELSLDEIETAVKDYLVKQGLDRSSLTGILFQKKDGSLNYEVAKVELSVKTE